MNPNITRVYLLNVPLESDYQHTLYFTSREEQRTFFEGKVVKSYHYDDFSYQRKDGIMNVPMMYDEALKCNYVMYQNSAYNNKWFYAFITDVQYVNEDCTNIKIETDVMQTYLFDYIMKPSFVEREHVSNDTPGIHTQPEQLEHGEYVNQYSVTDHVYGIDSNQLLFHRDMSIVVAVSKVTFTKEAQPIPKQYGGVYSGLTYLAFPTFDDCQDFIDDMQETFGADVISAVFMVPSALIKNDLGQPSKVFKPEGKDYELSVVPHTMNSVEILAPKLPIYDYLDGGYVPRNKKLLTYPYRALVMTNNSGSAHTYRYELFNTKAGGRGIATFQIKGVISPGCSIRLVPTDYGLGSTPANYTYKNEAEGLDAGKLPTCGWLNDAFTNWMTQNALNIPISLTQDSVGIFAGAGSMASGNISGGSSILSGLFGIANTIGEVYAHWTIPPTAKGGVNQGDYNFANNIGFVAYRKSIKKEYAEIIDSYFDMYGYKINKVKMPNKAHRSRYWFTKTINVNIDTTANDPNRDVIPQSDLQKIKDCYNRGITFWRNCNEIQNYSLSNGIAITDGAITD